MGLDLVFGPSYFHSLSRLQQECMHVQACLIHDCSLMPEVPKFNVAGSKFEFTGQVHKGYSRKKVVKGESNFKLNFLGWGFNIVLCSLVMPFN